MGFVVDTGFAFACLESQSISGHRPLCLFVFYGLLSLMLDFSNRQNGQRRHTMHFVLVLHVVDSRVWFMSLEDFLVAFYP